MPVNPYEQAASAMINARQDVIDDALKSIGVANFNKPLVFNDNEESALSNLQTNALNYQAFIENRDFMAGREDSAVQRMVSDMKKAGLNPAMLSSSPSGASSNAGSSGLPSAAAPQRVYSGTEKMKLNNKLLTTLITGGFSTLNTIIRLAGDAVVSAK